MNQHTHDTPQTLESRRLAVTREAILAYAEITGDWNPIHVDEAFAARSPMGGVIAHGTMSLNLIWQSLAATFGDAVTRGTAIDIRFVKPVRIGDVIEAGGRRGDDGQWEVWARNAAGEAVIEGTARVRVA